MRRMVLMLGLSLYGLNGAFAGEIVDHAGKAETALAAGNASGAYDEFKLAEDAIWTAMPLTVRKGVIVDSAVGYGVYTPRPDVRFPATGSILIYVEPVGYGYGKDGLGNIAMGVDVDLKLSTGDGKELGVVENISSINLSSRTLNREMFFKLTLDLSTATLPAGQYHADITLRDRNSSKRATFPIDFEITG